MQFRDIDRLEAAIMTAARTIGINTATAGLVGVGSERAYVTARFDRTMLPEGTLRIHQEDNIQAWGLSPEKKYQKAGGPLAGPSGAGSESGGKLQAATGVRMPLRK